MKMKFKSIIDLMDKKNRPEVYSESGSPFIPVYEYRYVEGVKTLVKSSETNVQDYIDSFADQADINVIIAKFLNGDTSVINSVVGQFGDFRDCPTTYAEMFDRVSKCETLFNSLPVAIKEKFENSYEKFWSSFGSSYFNDVFNDYNSSVREESVAVSLDDVNEVNNNAK